MLRVYTKRFINSATCTFNLLINSPQISLYSSSSSSSSTDDLTTQKKKSSKDDFKGFMQEYLVNSLGFSHEKADSTSTKLTINRKINERSFGKLSKNVVSVVDLLKNQGFNETHISKMVSLYPSLLLTPHKSIKPKLKSLIKLGISATDLIQIVSPNPKMLGSITGLRVLPVIQVLKEILVVDAHVIAVLKKLLFRSYHRACEFLPQNVAFLTSCGVTIESIRKHLVMAPSMFVGDPVAFKDIVIKVEKKLENPPNSATFLYGVHLFMFFSEENIESKCRTFKSFGWTQSDVNTLMVKQPRAFTRSDDNIKKKLEFLMNDVGLEPAHLASNSCFFTCSLEKRILPRHAVLKVLKEKTLVKKCPRLITVISRSESHFLKMFVLPFEDVHQVYADHIGCTVKSLTEQ